MSVAGSTLAARILICTRRQIDFYKGLETPLKLSKLLDIWSALAVSHPSTAFQVTLIKGSTWMGDCLVTLRADGMGSNINAAWRQMVSCWCPSQIAAWMETTGGQKRDRIQRFRLIPQQHQRHHHLCWWKTYTNLTLPMPQFSFSWLAL